MGTWDAGDDITAEKLNLLGIKALGRRQTTPAATTTIMGVLRLDDIPYVANRAYEVQMNPQMTGSITADSMHATIRYTTDGSTPTTASPILPGASIVSKVVVGTAGETRSVSAIHEAASDQTLSLLACIARISGTGNVTVAADATSEFTVSVIDVGKAVGNTGVSI
jgi:hypothetical protein